MNSGEPGCVRLEVPFHDVDALGVVWHGHYYKYFEIARTSLMRAHGLESAELRDSGYSLLVIESKCRYIAPLRYGDEFTVSARFKDVDHRIHIAYEIHNLTRAGRCAKGHTMLATLDPSGNLLLETPRALRQLLP